MRTQHLPRTITRILNTASALVLLGSLSQMALASDRRLAEENQAVKENAKRNVILIIGDGMDDNQITIARNYLKGARGKLQLDHLPLRSTSQVITVDEEQPDLPIYVADSANSATSMATGVATSRGRISTTAGDDQDLTTIAELAKAGGYATGIVSTADVADATPAVFISHIALRGCKGPSDMQPTENTPSWSNLEACVNDQIARGGKGSIAQQIATGNTDIVLGGGSSHFDQTAESSDLTLLALARKHGYQTVSSAEELPGLETSQKVLGLFAPSNLPTIWQGEKGRIAEKPSPSLLNRLDWRLGSVELPEPMRCEKNPQFGSTPTLKQLTDTALKHLAAQDGEGFFLMIESASIDKQSHARNPCGSIGELEQLEDALISALAFAEQEPETLILVTADHGQAAQLKPNISLFAHGGIAVYTPGHVARLITPENQIMAVNYATNDFPYEEHTGVNVPLYSNQQGLGRIAPMVTQPEIFNIMAQYLNLPAAPSKPAAQ
ncbi:alkaline phosphatase [Aestuariicella hydrocarbonica]|uniref:Alkaline phosphatase n=1 Tax=Pseudomaricurvus hydrocarbonicus TaxID=1470433 RepID=A0A9E5JU15_9GAMM|nr:alkaline phosphatase [Aestuariicella hydrocarbonica]NHO65578.1 alkaline phosphatase [Aestuariicella hydrocarbonica]